MTDDRDWYDRSAYPELRQRPPWVMEEMIESEPGLAERVIRDCDLEPVAALLRAPGRHLAIGCGTSEHAAAGIALQLRAAGVDVRAGQALEVLLDLPRHLAAVVAVSHEAGTWATEQALAAARAAAVPTGLVTAQPGGTIAPLADALLITPELDRSWCHTVGYLSPIVAGAGLAGMLGGIPVDPSEVAGLVRDGLGQRPAAAAAAAALAGCDRLIVIGCGADLVSARELVLKVEEACHLPAAMRELETMLHGHLPATGPGTGLVMLDTATPVGERRRRGEALLAACARVGISCAAIAAHPLPPELVPAGAIGVPTGGGLPPSSSALIGAAIPLQLLALELALARGRNPDLIRREQAAYREAAAIAEGR